MINNWQSKDLLFCKKASRRLLVLKYQISLFPIGEFPEQHTPTATKAGDARQSSKENSIQVDQTRHNAERHPIKFDHTEHSTEEHRGSAGSAGKTVYSCRGL